MALRKICKCCKRKRELHHLDVIGFAHNNGKVWICKNGDLPYNGCKYLEWKEVRDKYREETSNFVSDIQRRTEEHRKKLFGGTRY